VGVVDDRHMSTNKGSGDAWRLTNMGSNIDAWNGSIGA
jgi:hypothetical protein